ncbi:MAG: class I lanthipeptide [Candidatus Aminicenantes bacterium]|nr:class I lanthipeptide [Candidatus Aminicenantes bacterium]
MTKKLKLNKRTVSNLSREDLSDIKAGGQRGCWENLWTMYYCEIVYTGAPQTDALPANLPEDIS